MGGPVTGPFMLRKGEPLAECCPWCFCTGSHNTGVVHGGKELAEILERRETPPDGRAVGGNQTR